MRTTSNLNGDVRPDRVWFSGCFVLNGVSISSISVLNRVSLHMTNGLKRINLDVCLLGFQRMEHISNKVKVICKPKVRERTALVIHCTMKLSGLS